MPRQAKPSARGEKLPRSDVYGGLLASSGSAISNFGMQNHDDLVRRADSCASPPRLSDSDLREWWWSGLVAASYGNRPCFSKSFQTPWRGLPICPTFFLSSRYSPGRDKNVVFFLRRILCR